MDVIVVATSASPPAAWIRGEPPDIISIACCCARYTPIPPTVSNKVSKLTERQKESKKK
jgi:hypothetical protein